MTDEKRSEPWLEDDTDGAPATVAALVEALDFYACVDHYPVRHAVAPDVVRNDGGTKACAALALYREAGR